MTHQNESTRTNVGLSHRALQMLRAVAERRAEMTCSCEPDLFVDGLACCDQATAHDLVHAGLIQPAYPMKVGRRVPVEVTTSGLTVITEALAAK